MVGRLTLAAGTVLLAFAAACGGGGGGEATSEVTPVAPVDGQIEVRATEWSFEPAAILLTAGENVSIHLKNDGRILHDFKIDGIPADVVRSDSSGPLSADEGEAFVGAESSADGTLELVPLEPGTYAFYCSIQGHRALGMEGTVVVKAAP